MSQPQPTDNASTQTQLDVVRLQRAVANLTHDVQTLSRELARSLLEREELSILRERLTLMTRELDEAYQNNAALTSAAEQTSRQNLELQNQVQSIAAKLEQALALLDAPKPSKLSQLMAVFLRK